MSQFIDEVLRVYGSSSATEMNQIMQLASDIESQAVQAGESVPSQVALVLKEGELTSEDRAWADEVLNG